MWSNRRRGYIRRVRRAFCGRRVIDGFLGPGLGLMIWNFDDEVLRKMTYVFGFGVALKKRFDGFVLFVELSQIGDEVFDDVGVGEGIDSRFLGGTCRDTACIESVSR